MDDVEDNTDNKPLTKLFNTHIEPCSENINQIYI